MFGIFIRHWIIPDNPSSDPDCLIVLSYAVKNRNEPVLPTRAVIGLARNLQRAHPRAYVIMSTGDNQGLGVTNAHVMAIYGKSIGIPFGKIIEEGESKTTFGNLKYSAEIMRKRGLSRPVFVLYDLHVRRTLAIARAAGWKDVHWVSASSGGEPAYGFKSLQTRSRASIFLYELLAYTYNTLKGQI